MAFNGEKLQQLLDTEEIRSLVQVYCHHVWQRNGEAVADLFVEDGVFNNPDYVLTGRAALKKHYDNLGKPGQPGPYPYIHNHVVNLDGGRASGYCYLDLKNLQNDGRILATGGYYKDEYVKSEGRWRFSSRSYTRLISDRLPAA